MKLAEIAFLYSIWPLLTYPKTCHGEIPASSVVTCLRKLKNLNYLIVGFDFTRNETNNIKTEFLIDKTFKLPFILN